MSSSAFPTPTVTFVVPCYNLAHLLTECVESILAQTHQELEVLILDDCSPDDTPDVAKALESRDPRVKHIRNEVNLRHLANYNKGIRLAKGKYVWLISADDKLRRPYVVEKFAGLMDAHPEVGFVFCPVMKFRDGAEFTQYGSCGERDAIWKGRDFLLEKLLHGNIVPAPSGVARKDVWERAGLFPLDLPFAGDWYMWSAFALDADVGYFAEPMVSYRDHPLNMTKTFKEKAHLLMADEVAVLSRVLRLAEAKGDTMLVAQARRAVAANYAYRVAERAKDPEAIGMTVEEFEESMRKHGIDDALAAECRGHVLSRLGDHYFDGGDIRRASECYDRAVLSGSRSLGTLAKCALARGGKAGAALRRYVSTLRGAHRAGSDATPRVEARASSKGEAVKQ